MATVFKKHGWRVVIYPNDHPPPHVHVIAGGKEKEAVFYLNCPTGSVKLRDNWGFNQRELSRIQDELESELSLACAKWREIHGDS